MLHRHGWGGRRKKTQKIRLFSAMTQIYLQSLPTEGHTLGAAALLYRQHLQRVGRAVSVAKVAAGTWWAQKTKACFCFFLFFLSAGCGAGIRSPLMLLCDGRESRSHEQLRRQQHICVPMKYSAERQISGGGQATTSPHLPHQL